MARMSFLTGIKVKRILFAVFFFFVKILI